MGKADKEEEKDQEEPFDLPRDVEDDVDHNSKMSEDSQLKQLDAMYKVSWK